MAINPTIGQLIQVIVSTVHSKDSYITKTKLLKLLYLFDVEYYRKHRKIFTGFDWIYYHLGPWTPQYDGVINQLTSQNLLLSSFHSNEEIDAVFFRTPSKVGLSSTPLDFKDEMILKQVLDTWADKPTEEILNYTYFRTAPMEQGERGRPLDFDLIPIETQKPYVRSSSGKTPQEIAKLKKAFEEKRRATEKEKKAPIPFTSPNYDEEYWEAIEKMEELAH